MVMWGIWWTICTAALWPWCLQWHMWGLLGSLTSDWRRVLLVHKAVNSNTFQAKYVAKVSSSVNLQNHWTASGSTSGQAAGQTMEAQHPPLYQHCQSVIFHITSPWRLLPLRCQGDRRVGWRSPCPTVPPTPLWLSPPPCPRWHSECLQPSKSASHPVSLCVTWTSH